MLYSGSMGRKSITLGQVIRSANSRAISSSANTTRSTPSFSSIFCCSLVVPLAITREAPSSLECRVASSEGVISSPKATNTALASLIGRCRSVSGSVTSPMIAS